MTQLGGVLGVRMDEFGVLPEGEDAYFALGAATLIGTTYAEEVAVTDADVLARFTGCPTARGWRQSPPRCPPERACRACSRHRATRSRQYAPVNTTWCR